MAKKLTYEDAAHLLRRMGFGAPPDEINSFVGARREKAVKRLLEDAPDLNLANNFEFLLAKSSADLNDEIFNETEVRAWWLAKMALSPQPFREKMTLFWHNYFATSVEKVPILHMYTQNLDLRDLALAKFDHLLLKISQGAAMLIWLDGMSSSKTSPNENFARELQEIYSMGTVDVVTGEANYTEADVKEIARAFTGWRFRKSATNASVFAYEWYLDESQFDSSAKSIYGQTANFTGQDVITIVAAKMATARHLVYKLFEFFVYPINGENAEDRATIEKFAAVYLQNEHSIKALVEAIFTSDEFFSQRARFALIKNPVEFVMGALRMLQSKYLPGTRLNRDTLLAASLRTMGMELLRPPDVFGWKLNLGFLENQTMLERMNITEVLSYGTPTNVIPRSKGVEPLSISQLLAVTRANPEKTAKYFLDAFGLLNVDEAVHRELQRFLSIGYNGDPIEIEVTNSYVLLYIRSLLRLIMCLPEFQLN